MKMCQGDCGNCKANYRCCLPALAGFVSPHSTGPGKKNFAARPRPLQAETPDIEMSGAARLKIIYRLVLMFSGTPVAAGAVTSIGAPALSWPSTSAVMSVSVPAKTTISVEALFRTSE